MADRFILADLTSHRRGFGVQSVINAAARRAQNTSPAGKLIWIIPSHLAEPFAVATPVICDYQGPLVWSEIEHQIALIRSKAPDAEILIITWEQFVYDRAQACGLGISRLKWFDLIGERAIFTPSPLTQSRPMEKPISSDPANTAPPSRDEIEELIFTHLRAIGATSESGAMYRSQLRPALVRNNPPLLPRLTSPQFRFILKNVVDSAISAGRLAQPPSPKGQERLWLVQPQSEIPTIPVPVVPVGGAPVPDCGVLAQLPIVPVYARSAEFRKRLTDIGIFCEKRERDIFFAALAQILAVSAKPISKLRRELPRVAQEIANERAVNCTDFKRVVNFFLKLLLMSEVLLGPTGAVVRRNVGAEAASVASLDNNAQDTVEKYLLEQILRKSDVRDREHWQLAHAIFRQFDQSVEIDDMLDRVATLIAALGQKFILTDEGRYEYTGVGTNVVPLRA